MADNQGQDPEIEDRSDETLTPGEAYRLREDVGLQNKTIAKMFGITPGRASQLYNDYEEAVDEGRNSVDASDFPAEDLEAALEDTEAESRMDAKCPACGEPIPKPDEAGAEDCPECSTTLNWSEDEI